MKTNLKKYIYLALMIACSLSVNAQTKKPPFAMIAIDASVVEISETSTRDLGISYSFNRDENMAPNSIFEGMFVNFPFTPDTVTVPNFTDSGSSQVISQISHFPGLGINLVGINTSKGIFEANLRAMLEEGEAEIVSQPTAVSIEGEKVEIETTDEVPFQDVKFDKKGNPVMDVSFESVGVKLHVTPTLVGEKREKIKLDIHNLEVSGVSTYTTIKNISRPVFVKSDAHTDIVLNNRETLIIGGLKSDRERISENRIPVLGRIPILGFLFKNQKKVHEKVDVLFFMTPYILHDGENPPMKPDFLHQSDEDLKI